MWRVERKNYSLSTDSLIGAVAAAINLSFGRSDDGRCDDDWRGNYSAQRIVLQRMPKGDAMLQRNATTTLFPSPAFSWMVRQATVTRTGS